MILFSFIILFFESLIFLYFSSGVISRTYWVFQLIFMSFVPFIQYINDVVPWGFRRPDNISYLIANIFLFLANFIFYLLTKKKTGNNIIHNFHLLKLINHQNNSNLLPKKLIFITLLSCIIWFSLTGIPTLNQLIYRVSNDDSQGIELNSSLSLLFETIRYIPFASFILYKLNYKNSRFINFIFILIILIVCPPTAISRFMAGTIYLTILIFLYTNLLNGYRITTLIGFGFFILFPLMDELRVLSRDINISNALSLNYFLSENYDTYNSLVVVIDQNIITYGYQLLGTIFFIIPRTFWPTKPIGSGSYVAGINQLSFTNISFNYYAEGFINFGYFGILLFAIFLGLLVRYIESIKRILLLNKLNQINATIYIMLIPYLLFILRGDLMSSISFFTGIISALLLVFFIQKNI